MESEREPIVELEEREPGSKTYSIEAPEALLRTELEREDGDLASRVRGPGSGLGKTGGKGQKGQKSRHPGDFGKTGFQGGQMPINRRTPSWGFHNLFSKKLATVNLRHLSPPEPAATVAPGLLRAAGIVRTCLGRVPGASAA